MLVVIVEITVNSSINVILHLSFAYFLIANGVKHSFKEEVSSKMVYLAVEGRAANGDAVVLDEDHVDADLDRKELCVEAVLHVSGHLDRNIFGRT